MYDFTSFGLRDMTTCGAQLRKLGSDAKCMQDVASRVVRLFYDEFRDEVTGDRSCALVRFFKTHPLNELSVGLREFACHLLGESNHTSAIKCLTLLATAGIEPAWNQPRDSAGHQAIPLAGPEMILRSPMLHQLIAQLGLGVRDVLAPSREMLVDLEQRTFNVFHVPEAEGSPYVPAQIEFVRPYRIRSVLGFGGLLPSGHLFAVILFSRVPIDRSTSEMFKPLSLSVKAAVLAFDGGAVFSPAA